MKSFHVHTSTEFEEVFKDYPPHIRPKMQNLRSIIRDCAEELENITQMEETLKWGEPSYLVDKGSTIRIDWKEKTPNQYAMYFKCTSKLVPTFRKLYKDIFTFEENRAITFKMKEKIPEKELKQCIKTALRYHTVKHLKNLGIE